MVSDRCTCFAELYARYTEYRATVVKLIISALGDKKHWNDREDSYARTKVAGSK